MSGTQLAKKVPRRFWEYCENMPGTPREHIVMLLIGARPLSKFVCSRSIVIKT